MKHLQNNALRQFWLVLGILSIVVAGCGATNNTDKIMTLAQLQPPANVVVIPQGSDVFAPFIVPIQPQTTVFWLNHDKVQHVITTTPEHQSFLNPESFSLQIDAGKTGSYTFTTPGIYHYYDNHFSTWNINQQRVTTEQASNMYPMTMEGVIWVEGPIPNLPAAAFNSVPNGHDRIVTNFLAIQKGGSVTWHNYDTDAHFFQPVLGWSAPINPVDIGINDLRGSDMYPPDGESRSIAFNTPGLYYYYCFTHAEINPIYLRAYASKMASDFPLPMEGFVLVV